MTKDKRDAVIWLLSMFKADELGELEPLPTWYQGIDKDIAEAVELAISALSQPDIEAIRQEIEALKNQPPQYDDMFEYISGINDALYVIDKYIHKAESEE